MPGSPPTRRWIIISPFGATVVFEPSATLTDATSKAGGWATGWPNAMHEMKAIRPTPMVVLVIYFSFASQCGCFPHLAWGGFGKGASCKRRQSRPAIASLYKYNDSAANKSCRRNQFSKHYAVRGDLIPLAVPRTCQRRA